MANLAVFDLDHTLLDVDSDHSWGQFLVERRLVDAAAFAKANDGFYQDYLKGVLNPVAYNEFVAAFLAKYRLEQLQAWRRDYLDAKIKPAIRPKAMQRLKWHQEQGDIVLISSSTNDFIVSAVAELFGVGRADTLATRLQTTPNGDYTGKVVGIANFQEGKVERLNAHIRERALCFETSCVYSDSKNDLPLLLWSDTAVCVNPDDTLRRVAEQKAWRIEDWALH